VLPWVCWEGVWAAEGVSWLDETHDVQQLIELAAAQGGSICYELQPRHASCIHVAQGWERRGGYWGVKRGMQGLARSLIQSI
jgi:phytoene dehydrogenase-like protein